MLALIKPDRGGMVAPPVFELSRLGSTLVIMPIAGYASLDDKEFTAEVNRMLAAFDASLTGVVVDLHNTTCCSSDRLLGPLVVVWNRIRKQHGRMSICGLYKYGREVLRRTKLDKLWPVCSTREEALDALQKCLASSDSDIVPAARGLRVAPGS